MKSVRSWGLLLTSVLLAPGVHATPITFSLFSSAYDTGQVGFAYDPVTGTFYGRSGYGTTDQPLNSYSTPAALAANIPDASFPLDPAASGCDFGPCTSLEGTYFAVNGGIAYGRPTDNTAELSTWDIATGAVQQTMSYVAFGGLNFTDTFDWGGFSGMNVLQDQTGMYLLAKASDHSTWLISTLGSDLSVANTVDTGISDIGFAFLMNGNLFVGQDFNSTEVSQRVNVQTGQVTAVTYTLSLPGAISPYLSNTMYDSNLDVLYVHDANTGNLYSLSDASTEFEVSAVPEPSTFSALGLALAAAGLWKRRIRNRTNA